MPKEIIQDIIKTIVSTHGREGRNVLTATHSFVTKESTLSNFVDIFTLNTWIILYIIQVWIDRAAIRSFKLALIFHDFEFASSYNLFSRPNMGMQGFTRALQIVSWWVLGKSLGICLFSFAASTGAGEISSDLYRTHKMNSNLIWRNTFIIVGDSSWYTSPIHETNQGNP